MTCIAGIKDKDRVWIGADSFGSTNSYGMVYNNKKVFKLKDNKNMLVGYTTSFRMGDLLEYSKGLIDEISVLKNEKIDREYIVTKIIPGISRLFCDNKFETNDNGEASGGNFLLANNTDLYLVQNDYSVLEPKEEYISCGSGMYFALSSLYSTKNTDMPPVKRIKLALETAEHFQINVRRPFVIMNTLDDEVITIE